jgi:hypothetical protein
VAADRGHRFSKAPQRDILLVEGHGVEGDAHSGASVRHRYLARRRPSLPNLRQVHLIPSELFETIGEVGYDVRPGELGENITTVGLELERMPLGTLIGLGISSVSCEGIQFDSHPDSLDASLERPGGSFDKSLFLRTRRGPHSANALLYSIVS